MVALAMMVGALVTLAVTRYGSRSTDRRRRGVQASVRNGVTPKDPLIDQVTAVFWIPFPQLP